LLARADLAQFLSPICTVRKQTLLTDSELNEKIVMDLQ